MRVNEGERETRAEVDERGGEDVMQKKKRSI